VIVIVHFVRLELFPFLIPTLRVGGHLYFETFGGHGQNHIDLPRPGEVKAALGVDFDLRYYEEKAASRQHPQAVTAKALARKLR
jgi:hypothetical protein